MADYLPKMGTSAREAAGKWAESATALLAIIGITTIFKGRETLDAIAEARQLPVLLAVLVSIIFAFLTLWAAAIAAQGISNVAWAAPNTFRQAQIDAADHARRWMNWSRRFVVVAFVASVAAVILIWTAPKPDATPTLTFVASSIDGTNACGELEVGAAGQLTVGGSALPGPRPHLFFSMKECPAASGQ